MAYKLQLRRGKKADLPTLDNGEPGFAQDTKELYIGTSNGNQKLTFDQTKYDSYDAQLADIAIYLTDYKQYVLNYGQPNEDWSPAIQQAIDYLANQKFGNCSGGVIIFPDGTFQTYSSLILKNYIKLRGKGSRSTEISFKGTGAILKFDDTYTSFFYDVEVSGMKLTGNNADNTNDGIYHNVQYGSNNCVFKDLWFYKIGRSAFRFEMSGTHQWYSWAQYFTFENIYIGSGSTIAEGTGDYAFYVAGGFSTNRFVNVRTYNVKKGFYFTSYNHPNGLQSPECNTFDTCNIQNINPSTTVTADNATADSVVHGIYIKDCYNFNFDNCYIEGISLSDSTKASSGVYVDGNSKNIRINGGLWSAFFIGVNFNSGTGGKVDGVTFFWNQTSPATAPTAIVMGAAFATYTLEIGTNYVQSAGTITYLNDNGRSIGFSDAIGTFNARTVKAGSGGVITTKATLSGDWQNPLVIGTTYIWRDSQTRLRAKETAPTSESDGWSLALNMSGTTAQRPTTGLSLGMPYYDTTLGYPVFYHGGGVWHNGSGVAV